MHVPALMTHASSPKNGSASSLWLCCINRRKQAVVPCILLSAHRIGLRTTQFPHPIEQLACQRDFPLLGRIPLCPQLITEGPFETGKDILGVGLSIIARCPFPAKPPLTLDRQHMLIALGRGGCSRGGLAPIFLGGGDNPTAQRKGLD